MTKKYHVTKFDYNIPLPQCTEVEFTSFPFGSFTNTVNRPDGKLLHLTSVQCTIYFFLIENLWLTSNVGDNTKDNFQFEKLSTAVGFLWHHFSHETKMALLSKLYSENMWTPEPATPD